ncbi:MAG: carbon-nitrogen hydrolase family protein [Betaproteobacteria bacterium]|nr:carbon-nitrogen hydrolase family protein [Betaproteobacteria bacterium]
MTTDRSAPNTTATTRIAAIQMVSAVDVATNLAQAERLLEQAASQGARLAALPEFFPLMGLRDTDKVAVRERFGCGPIQEFLSATARRLGLWIIGGSVPLEADVPDKVRNSCLVYDDAGRLAARYDKIHLFGFDNGRERYVESNTIEPGTEIVVLESPFGRIGLSICYDLRFPELYRRMGSVALIVVPSAFTATTGEAHWETLLRARAVENLAYVLAPAQGGVHASGRRTHGDSMIIDPWGEILARVPTGPGIAFAELDPGRIAAVRGALPALEHRTLDPI